MGSQTLHPYNTLLLAIYQDGIMHKFTSNISSYLCIASNIHLWYNTGIMKKVALYESRHLSFIRGGISVAVSKAQQKAVQKYVKDKYDRVVLTMPKGKKEAIREQADAMGLSVNAFINLAIDSMMEQGTPATGEAAE